MATPFFNSSGLKPWRYPNSSLSLSSYVQPKEDPISFTSKISPESDTDHHLLLSSWSRPSCHAYFCPCSLSIYFHTEIKMIFSCETLQRPPSSFQEKVMCSTGSQPGPVTSQLLPPTSLLTWLLCVKHASLRAFSLLSLLLGPLSPDVSRAGFLTSFRPLFKSHLPNGPFLTTMPKVAIPITWCFLTPFSVLFSLMASNKVHIIFIYFLSLHWKVSSLLLTRFTQHLE